MKTCRYSTIDINARGVIVYRCPRAASYWIAPNGRCIEHVRKNGRPGSYCLAHAVEIYKARTG